ncbi:MAG TPA: lactate utilization protein C, partial [Acetobacteraceae bacterium]|nr:lactate utilization protein C [Acetobacteraceae bacterium]
MKSNEASKAAILGNIRRGLKRGTLPPDQQAMLRQRLASHPRQIIPARTAISHAEQIELFIRMAEREYVTIARVPDASALPPAIADYLKSQNLPGELVVAPHPDLQSVEWEAAPLL